MLTPTKAYLKLSKGIHLFKSIPVLLCMTTLIAYSWPPVVALGTYFSVVLRSGSTLCKVIVVIIIF